jgi:ribosomal protein L24
MHSKVNLTESLYNLLPAGRREKNQCVAKESPIKIQQVMATHRKTPKGDEIKRKKYTEWKEGLGEREQTKKYTNPK